MKILSWNVNGIRSVLTKGFAKEIERENPDILCLQEIKIDHEKIDKSIHNYEHQIWNPAEKKGYSGTAIFSKIDPLSVKYNFGEKENHKEEGRIITLEFADFYLVNVYTPNSGRGLVRLKYRQEWDELFLNYILKLEKKKPVVICGDLNVAHTEIDLANPKSNYNKTAGYTQVEIDGIQRLLDAGYIDSFREFTQEKGHYTFWSQMFNARQRNVGWRIDYFLISKKLRTKMKKAFILPKVMGSDHCPVGLELER